MPNIEFNFYTELVFDIGAIILFVIILLRIEKNRERIKKLEKKNLFVKKVRQKRRR